MEPIYVTGIGFITSIGNDRENVTQSLREMKHGIEFHPELQVPESPVKIAGTVKGFEVDSTDTEDWKYPKYKVLKGDSKFFSHVLYVGALKQVSRIQFI